MDAGGPIRGAHTQTPTWFNSRCSLQIMYHNRLERWICVFFLLSQYTHWLCNTKTVRYRKERKSVQSIFLQHTMRRHFSSSTHQRLLIIYYSALSVATQFCVRAAASPRIDGEEFYVFYGCVWHITRCFCLVLFISIVVFVVVARSIVRSFRSFVRAAI